MKNKLNKGKFRELLRKCFGKNKDEKYHARAMLVIYGIFILAVVIFIRMGSSNLPSDSNQDKNLVNPIPTNDSSGSNNSTTNGGFNDVNYSYVYAVNYNGNQEVFTGQKVDEKEKFAYVSGGNIQNYAILSDNFLLLSDGKYSITNTPSSYFKYCDAEQILVLLADSIPTETSDYVKYEVTNKQLSGIFKDIIVMDSKQPNTINIHIDNDEIRAIDLDLTNYITSIQGSSSSLTIRMDFANIGTTPDFNIDFK